MRKWLTRCVVAAALIGILLLAVVHQLHAPPITAGRPLPPGKVKPQLASSMEYAMLLAPDGSLWAWGGMDIMRMLYPKYPVWSIPHRIGSDSNWTQLGCCFNGQVALKNDGTLWTWDFRQFTNPTRIGADTNWSQIRADWNEHNLLLKTDGSVWTWDVWDPPVPRMVGTDRDWQIIATGDKLNFAVKSNGTLWEWDIEVAPTNQSKPRQVMPDMRWRDISASPSVFIALKTDGTLWTTTTNLAYVASALVPDLTQELTQIGPDTDWAEIHAGRRLFYARKKDGSWWVSGWNDASQLGLPMNIQAVASPRRLPFNFDPWVFSTSGSSGLMLGKDGKLWTWGVRPGLPGPSPARKKFNALITPAVKRFPSLKFLTESLVVDQTPYLLWELPPEVRRSLRAEPKSSTNNFTN
jgi:alpha-tubulin suppressor-like RCC1 family protein